MDRKRQISTNSGEIRFNENKYKQHERNMTKSDKVRKIKWASSWENLFMPYANNKGADQPAHSHSLRSRAVWSAPLLFAA